MLRLKELDIKSWKPKEFAGLIKEIAMLAPKELVTFYNFTEVAFDVNYFEIKPTNFNCFADIFHVFVNYGYLHAKTRTAFYRAFLLGLKDMLVSKTEETSFAGQRTPSISTVSPSHLVPLLWSLLLTEDPAAFSPLTLRLIQDLSQFTRGLPLTPDELVMLYQVNAVI